VSAALISVILVGEDGWTDHEPSLLSERPGSAYAFHKPWWRGVKFFHREGTCYEVASARPTESLPPLSKLLAATVCNPSLTVHYEYRSLGNYDLVELKQALLNAIGQDDDILTQFHEADDLKRLIRAAASFDGVAEVLLFAETETD
jgi:hypothetical protein